MSAKNWTFTINNPTEDELLSLSLLENAFTRDPLSIVYTVYQTETGEAGTPHVQGFVQFGKRVSLRHVKEALSSRGHYEVARGTPQQNRLYCTKNEGRITGPFEFGEIKTSQGKRNDLSEFVTEASRRCIGESELISDYTNIIARYPRFATRVQQHYAESRLPTLFAPKDGWQRLLYGYLANEPHVRQVRWYFDHIGNTGKSYFANHFVSRKNDGTYDRGYVITGGKHADIYYAYRAERTIFFDWPRDGQESFPYQVVENFKNGYFLSTKYEPIRVRFDVPHVIIFANFLPDQTKLSADRWDIINL